MDDVAVLEAELVEERERTNTSESQPVVFSVVQVRSNARGGKEEIHVLAERFGSVPLDMKLGVGHALYGRDDVGDIGVGFTQRSRKGRHRWDWWLEIRAGRALPWIAHDVSHADALA